MEVVQIPASCGKAADLPTLCSLATDFQGLSDLTDASKVLGRTLVLEEVRSDP